MGSLMPAYTAGHLLVLHATGSIDPTRSHFDAQHFMEIGVPGNNNPIAGRITSTAYFGADPQRNFQFGVRYSF